MSFLASVAFVFAGCGTASVGSLSGEISSVEKDVPAGYRTLDVSNCIAVIWTTGGSASVTADTVVLPYITIEEVGSALKVYIKDSYRFRKGTGTVTVCLPANPEVSCIKLSGASSFLSENPLYADSFSLDVSGASSFKADISAENEISIDMSGASKVASTVNSAKLIVDASGASSAMLSGETVYMAVEASGATNVSSRSSRVSAKEVRCSVSGASDLYVNCLSRISGSASGASNLHYGDAGAVSTVSASGASSVSAE